MLFFVVLVLIFSKSTFSINSFRNTIRLSNSFDPDQAQLSVGPDLVPDCLQKLSVDDTRRYGEGNFLPFPRDLFPIKKNSICFVFHVGFSPNEYYFPGFIG